MTTLYPLVFEPVFKERVWGGRKLGRYYPDMPEGPVGEAWVLSGHPEGLTKVSNGPLAGETLPALLQRFGADLAGHKGLVGAPGSFPLLFKLLDARDDLSVQVHPADGYPGLPPGELGKTEMWAVLDAAPGSRAIYGLQPGTTPAQFAAAVAERRTLDVLRQVEVRPGDVLYVPAGTVHALGAGLLVAEIQQSSDTVYRVYDYDRPGLDGKPRELHIEHALKVTAYGHTPAPQRLPALAPDAWTEICRSPFFAVDHAAVGGAWPQQQAADSFQVLMVLEGNVRLDWEGGQVTLAAGAAALTPAALKDWSLAGSGRLLRVTIP